MKVLLTILSLSLGLVPCSRADYMIPGIEAAMLRITDVLDVEVTSMNEEGHAEIKILKAYKSGKETAKVITGVGLSCTGGSPKMFGMKPGRRYIVLLVGNDLYEESSYFPVKEQDGVLMCKLGWYGDKTWLNTKEEWIPVKTVEAKLAEVTDRLSLKSLVPTLR